MISIAQQAWFDQCVAAFAEPRPDLREIRGERVFVRDFPKRCPCGRVFFTYAQEGAEREPYRVDPNPERGRGTRETCGHPLCFEAEERYQALRRQNFRGEAAPAQAAS